MYDSSAGNIRIVSHLVIEPEGLEAAIPKSDAAWASIPQITPAGNSPGGRGEYFTGPNTDPRQYDIPVPDGYVVDNPLDAKAVVEKIGKFPWRRSDF